MNDTDDKLTEAWRTPQSEMRAEAMSSGMLLTDTGELKFSARTEQMREMLHDLKEGGDENAAMILRLQGMTESIVATLDAIGVTLTQVQTQLTIINTRLSSR